jgi:hypothetical protein
VPKQPTPDSVTHRPELSNAPRRAMWALSTLRAETQARWPGPVSCHRFRGRHHAICPSAPTMPHAVSYAANDRICPIRAQSSRILVARRAAAPDKPHMQSPVLVKSMVNQGQHNFSDTSWLSGFMVAGCCVEAAGLAVGERDGRDGAGLPGRSGSRHWVNRTCGAGRPGIKDLDRRVRQHREVTARPDRLSVTEPPRLQPVPRTCSG